MATLRDRWQRVAGLFRKDVDERALDEEVRFHIDMQTEKNVRLGMPADEARRAALLSFGGTERFKEEARDEQRSRTLDDLRQDLRYGLRMLRNAPAFTAVAVTSLALGIGANTAVFSVVNAVLLRPLPYPGAERLVAVEVKRDVDDRGDVLSVADVRALEERARSYAAFGAYWHERAGIALTTRGEAEQIDGTRVTAGVLRALGVAPLLGRTPLPAEDRAGGDRVVVLSHSFWRDRYGASPSALGQPIILDGQQFTIVGVMPPGFALPNLPDDDVWPVLQLDPPTYRAPYWLGTVARLAPGVSVERARAELAGVAKSVKAQYPDSPPQWSYTVTDLKSLLVRDARTTVLVLYGAVALILLMAAANVANLFLARASSRGPELAVRTALGAGRARLAQQLVTESVLVALVGGALGLVLAVWGVRLLGALTSVNLPRLHEVSLDGTVLLFTAGTALATGLLIGIAPALQVPHHNLDTQLREGGRSGAVSAERRRLRAALVVAEFAIAVTVLIGAGLAVNSLLHLQRVDPGPGVGAARILAVRLTIPEARYPQPEQAEAFYDEVLRRVTAQPGVQAASVTMALPPNRLVMTNPFTPEGKVYASGESAPLAEELLVGPSYFAAFGIPVRRGRAFTDADREGAPPVAIVNETLARRFFPGRDAVGRWLQTGDPDPDATKLTIVGVVPDVKYAGLDAPPEPTIYVAYKQNRWWRSMYLVVRAAGDPLAQLPAVRAAVSAADPQVPLRDVLTMDQLLVESVAQPRFRAALLSGFGLVALLLASAGIYGVMTYTVNQRRRETGVRLALGAPRGDIVRMMIGHGMRLAAAGVALGVGLALLLTRLITGVLFEVSPVDPATFALAALFLVSVGRVACALPAHRASRTDPMVALRGE